MSADDETISELWKLFDECKATVDRDGDVEMVDGVLRLTEVAERWEVVAAELARLLPADEGPPTSLLELVVGP